MTESETKSVGLRAGSATVDLTPKAGAHLGGTWGVLRDARVIAERLFARATVFLKGERKLCLIAPDLEIVTRKYSERIRAEVHARCGIEPEAVMVHLPQPHSTPPLGNFILDDDFPDIPSEHEYLRGSQSEYCEFAVQKIVECVEKADAGLEAVQVAAGRAVRDGLAFNRRGVTRDGGIVMPWLFSSQKQPLGPTEICYLEGPTDPEVGVFCVRDREMRMRSMLLHFTCHPVNVFALTKHVVSPDWPGTWAAEMQRLYGPECVPLILNGCCGNINPWPAFEPDFMPDHRRMGHELAATAEKVAHSLSFTDEVDLDWQVRHVKLPLKEAGAEDLAAARELLREHPNPIWLDGTPPKVKAEWMDAAMLLCVERERERDPDYAYEIQVLRIGDVAIVGLPGEPFVEGQLAIKVGSPAAFTFVAHGTTDYAGYIAPTHAYPRGGHEIRTKPAKWAKLEAGALEKIVESTQDMLRQLFG